jgi:DnaK suppressor protein
MTVPAMNLDACRAALLAKADECKQAVSRARRALSEDAASMSATTTHREPQREEIVERMETAHRLLRQVEVALSRLQRGRYGRCLKCEEGIGLKRLSMAPWALFCLECQQGVDLLQYGAGTHQRRIGEPILSGSDAHSFWTEWQQDDSESDTHEALAGRR